MILEREEDLARQNENATLPTSGGYLMTGTTTVNTALSGSLVAGTYRLEVAGGKGGTGSKGYANGTNGGAGGAGANGNIITATLILDKTTSFTAYIGGNGNDGDPTTIDTTDHGGGGGGGGASGMDSLLVFYESTHVVKEMIAFGGSGGGGGRDMTQNGGGGGGGGSRYGTASNGIGSTDGSDTGGKGGNCNQEAKGGAPYNVDGGTGGTGGYSGNSYAGQKGAAGNGDGGDADGGAGGAKTQVDITILSGKKDAYGSSDPIIYSLISAGGGGRGEHVSGHGGSGASGVKTTSSGYVRIYRLW
jgi:hypothetical protein